MLCAAAPPAPRKPLAALHHAHRRPAAAGQPRRQRAAVTGRDDACRQPHAHRRRAVRQAGDAQARGRRGSAPRRAARALRPPGSATVPRRPPRGAPKRPLPGRSSIERSAGPPEATASVQAAAARRAAGDSEASWQSVAVTWSSASTGGPPPTGGCARRRRAGRPRTSSTAPAAGRARPRRGAGRRRRASTSPTATRARSAAARVADREGDEQAVARDQAAVGVADAHGSARARPAPAARSRGRGATMAAHGALGAGAAEPPAGRARREQRGEQGDGQAAGLHGACNAPPALRVTRAALRAAATRSPSSARRAAGQQPGQRVGRGHDVRRRPRPGEHDGGQRPARAARGG